MFQLERILVSDILYGFARPLNGSRLKDSELVKLAHEELSDIQFSIVRRWIILDVLVSAERHKSISEQGLQPTVLYSQALIYDSAGNAHVGNSEVSDYLKVLQGCFFETQERLFILAGSGARRHISTPAMDALHLHIGSVRTTWPNVRHA